MSEIYDHFKKLEKEKQNTWGKENYKEQKQMREKRQMEKISNVIFEKRYKQINQELDWPRKKERTH